MFQDVAVRHVWIVMACRVREAQKDLRDAPGRDGGCIFPACSVGLGRLAIARDDPKLAAVNVNRMQHAVGSFRNSPAQRLVAGGRKVDSVKREGLAHGRCGSSAAIGGTQRGAAT